MEKRLLAAICILAVPNMAVSMPEKPPEGKKTTTTQQAADAKVRESKTGTSNEDAAKRLKEVDRELESQKGPRNKY